ncbi:MAG: tRNA preQ1(34) S-adenosylmethionine ribosyltransferase-isomerase QueA [Deltaproteobacteria bacterium]|nr:tRNA preQ1(34) S-adenosylmethionine ribosyltransferase-isomerase QueA [Deltaproteobacteria bacterium]
MLLKDFSFSYPPELVAQEPANPRDSSRLLVLDRSTQGISHSLFRDLPSFFKKGDLLILNNTKVLPARLWAQKETGGKLEVLIVAENQRGLCSAMIFPSKNIKAGQKIFFESKLGKIEAEIIQPEGKVKQLLFSSSVSVRELMLEQGAAPLPPYIKRAHPKAEDLHRYQTIFAQKEGAIAAPTASLHFTEAVLKELREKGVEIHFITLHVGMGTFEPVRVEKIEEHQMQTEYYEVPDSVAAAIQNAKQEGRPITAVGTTVVRSLESYYRNPSPLEGEGSMQATSLYITPGYKFQVIDRFLTNFHQPESTPLLLTSAFAGAEFLKKAYAEAIAQKYRLFSYGDCMWIG